jgi:hypothetical protein
MQRREFLGWALRGSLLVAASPRAYSFIWHNRDVLDVCIGRRRAQFVGGAPELRLIGADGFPIPFSDPASAITDGVAVMRKERGIWRLVENS